MTKNISKLIVYKVKNGKIIVNIYDEREFYKEEIRINGANKEAYNLKRDLYKIFDKMGCFSIRIKDVKDEYILSVSPSTK
jgi:hypothetical protein